MSTHEQVEGSGPLLLGTCLITCIRCILFFSCRRYVDAGLFQQLKQDSSHSSEAYCLDILPPPSAAPTPTSTSARGTLPSALAKNAFSACFSESCTLFFLLLCQALRVFNIRVRTVNWAISLGILLLLIVIAIPLCLSFICTSSLSANASSLRFSFTSVPRLVVALIPLAIYFFTISYIPLPTALSSPSADTSISYTALARITVLGTVILGCLSGYGSVSTSWGYFPLALGNRRTAPSQAELDAAEQSLRRVRADIDLKRGEIAVILRRDADPADSPAKNASWLSRVTPNFRGPSELSNLNTELSALCSLEDNMTAQLRILQQRHAASAFNRTWRGRVSVLGRHATGFYCIFRSITSAFSILLPATAAMPAAPTSTPGLLTSSLVLLPFDPAYTAAALRHANLLVVGLIIWGSVRRVLRNAARALRLTSRTLSAALVLLMLSQLMGIYLLSTLVQLRTSFPPPENGFEETANLFLTLPEYQLFGSTFDWSFLLAAGVAAGTEWVRAKSEGDD
ncbi:hypothetical protein FA95DRAFT_1682344 [Auriscalpium vulgare]|uniref:Uncharacterized protein n=1 Tax=Auriscalpium vulgare TaxID=40419 RepID=A0ACB8RFG1_9AGAM|nr:hypothetical protein FA95DRAFT_1682344 [Auriscalpium vulgare]